MNKNLRAAIAEKIQKIAAGRKGGNSYIVVKDTPECGIWGTDANTSAINSGGGILCIIPADQVNYGRILERDWWYWRVEQYTNINDLAAKIAAAWEAAA